MAKTIIPTQAYNMLKVTTDQKLLLGVVVSVSNTDKSGIALVSFSINHQNPAPTIPQGVYLVDGYMTPNSYDLPRRLIQGHPIRNDYQDVFEVRSGYLTIIPLQAYRNGLFMSTDSILDFYSQGSAGVMYEDSPNSDTASRRYDMYIQANNVQDISREEYSEMSISPFLEDKIINDCTTSNS